MTEYRLTVEELPVKISVLKAGDRVCLSGEVYTARDAAHKRLQQLLQEGKSLPFPLNNAVIYYAGPTPSNGLRPVGACGPTTSSRMDPYTPLLLTHGLIAMIGKGERSEKVIEAIVKRGAVYFCAVGGAGALASQRIIGCEVIAFEELGCESIKRLRFEHFPLTVGIDSNGGCVFANTNIGGNDH